MQRKLLILSGIIFSGTIALNGNLVWSQTKGSGGSTGPCAAAGPPTRPRQDRKVRISRRAKREAAHRPRVRARKAALPQAQVVLAARCEAAALVVNRARAE